MSAKWDKRYLRKALDVRDWSKDRSTKVGCIFIDEKDGSPLTWAWNGLPRKTNDNVEARHERPEKYKWMQHAEINAINNCSRRGVSSKGATAYVTLMPCGLCAGALIQAGIRRVVYIGSVEVQTGHRRDWNEDFKVAMELFDEAKIDISVYTKESLYEDEPT